jgi:hypothetical protein
MKSFSAFVSAALVMMLVSCEKPQQQQAQAPDLSNEELIKRGKYIVTVSACHDCHSPKVMTEHGPEPDTTRLLSGHPKDEPIPELGTPPPGWTLFSPSLTASRGEWGISYAANLTPDDTGIGNWSFGQFKKAIREGKYKGLDGSRPLMPPMPWQMYRNYTDDDLVAVFAYLKSLKPINNLVPANISIDKLVSFIKTKETPK